MQNIYAALLLHKLGKPIDMQGIKHVVEAAGGHADEGSIKSLVASLQGVDINKALEEAKSAPVAAGAAAPAAHEKKEEKKEEPKAELAAEGLAALFG
jgi:large subunit ribosomal protein L12